MQYETLPDGSQIPVLGLGTWPMGGGTSADYSRDEEYVALIQQAIEMGYTHIDTAESYGDNHTEELVGRAIQGFDRSDLFITTKVSPEHLHYKDVLKSLEGSLKRLDTDYVDLYLIHWPNDSIPLSDTFRALNQVVADGRVKRVGVSNFDVDLLQEARELAETPIATDQVRYNLLDQKPRQNGLLAYCQQNAIPLTAYSPLKGGVLNHATVVDIAQKHQCTPAQVALNWLVRQPQVITIAMSSDEDHLQQNLEALSLALSEEDVQRLNALA